MKAQRFFGVLGLVCAFVVVLPARAQVTNFQWVHSFGNVDLTGAYPEHIIQGSDGRLYGIASLVQFDRRGVVYSLKRDGTDFRILHRFKEDEPTGSGLTRGLLEGSEACSTA